MKKLLSGIAVFGLVCGMVQAQEWKLGLGVSYRVFDDVDFSSLQTSQLNNISLIKASTDGAVWEPFDGDFSGYRNSVYVVEGVNVPYSGDNSDFEGKDQWAPVLSAEYLFMTKDEMTLSLVANFQYFGADLNDSVRVANTATQNTYFVANGEANPIPLQTESFGDLTASVRNEFDMDLYVLDLGVKIGLAFDNNLGIFAAVGPTVNIADMDSKVTESASVDGGKFYQQSQSDSSTDLLFGIYGSVGAQWWLTETMGLVIEARYDEVFEDADTDLAEIDLSGFSGMAKLMFIF